MTIDENTGNAALDPVSDDHVLAATRRWIERAVIGLNLCPFARLPYVENRLRLRVSHAATTDALIEDLCGELGALQANDPEVCETSMLIHPQVLGDFLAFNDFLDAADNAMHALGLEGEIQIASFHPDYRFADADADDVSNCSNRSPYPILHLLRESSIERAVQTMADPDAIYQRNIETLRVLGHDGWARLWQDETGDPADAATRS